MFVQIISSEPQIVLLPKLVRLCCITNLSISQKKTGSLSSMSRAQWGLIESKCAFAMKLGLIIHHHKLECPVRKKNGSLHSRSRSQQRFNMWVNVCRDNICWITGHFVTKFGMVMQHHEPGSCGHFVVVAIFKVKVTARVHMIKIWLFRLYYLNCFIPWQPSLIWWYIISS